MARFIENVNTYISQMKIKQTYISMKTGIDTKKLSRILTGTQDVTSTDMDKIAEALGQKTEFFFSDSLKVSDISNFVPEKIAFYAGEPTKKQEKIAEQLVEFIECIDKVMGARLRFRKMAEE